MYPKPKKRLGQCFLVDKNIQNKLAEACGLRKSDTVLEIGPGRGEITALLVRQVKKVIAIEIDSGLCEILRQKFSSYKNFMLFNKDILKMDLSKYKNLKIVANLPYYISTPILAHLLKYRNSIKTIFCTLQKELAMRLVAGAGTKIYGAFSCFVQFYTRPKIVFFIKNESFRPKPKVDSCFMELKIFSKPPVKVKDEQLFFKLVRTAFNQRRKQIKNSLIRILTKDKITRYLKTLKLKPGVRAENLSLRDFAALAK